jgi:hypothetical protein
VAYEQRAPRDYVAGTLSTAAAISDTALVAAAFSALPTDYTTTKVLPLTLHDPSTGVYEVVWVTAHSAASTTVTVVRAREGTTALAWPSGSYVICAPTVRDTQSASTLAGLPTDAHTGMRAIVTDKGYAAERLHSGAWGASTGVALGDDIGPRRAGGYPPATAGLYLRAGHVHDVTDASGQINVAFRTPFPSETVVVMITALSSSVPIYSIFSENNVGFTAQVWAVSSLSPFTTVPFVPGYTAIFTYLALGY